MLLGVDVGGTFTDAVAVTPAGDVHTAKVPSTPQDQSEGVLAVIEAVLARASAQPGEVRRLAHGMTVATNALLEGKVASTALIATQGVTDVIELGRQARPHLYRLCERGPEPLSPPELRFGAPERMGPEGIWQPLDPQAADELIERVASANPQAVAVVLLHSYANAEHERILGALIKARMPTAHVSLSSELVGTFREYERAATTEVDAALSPLLKGYVERLSAKAKAMALPEPEIMQSSGGLMEARRAGEHAALTVLSGPAGGVGGALLLASRAGEQDVVCFDMGGTSCDVCVIEQGEVAETAQRTVAGRPLALPALDIHTVGAGGGSIAWRDAGGALRVGPRSAGAVPGPACYGRGGTEPTVTDANLLLGRLLKDIPLAGDIELDHEAAERAVAKLARPLNLSTPACAEGIVRVAEAEMARALRVMTVQRGVDPREMALMPFGGAGPLHAAALARELGMRRILCPRASGVLCALGLAAASPRRDAARTVMLSGEALSSEAVRSERDALLAQVRAQARGRVVYEMRYAGQSFELGVNQDSSAPVEADLLRKRFAETHEERYGYRDEDAEVELVTIRVSGWGEAPEIELGSAADSEPRRETRAVVFAGSTIEAQCLRGDLPAGTEVKGPTICALEQATLWVPPGWQGEVDAQGTVLLQC